MTNFNQKAKILKTLNFRLYIYIYIYIYLCIYILIEVQFSFACFKLINPFSSKPDLQHEVLPDNCKIENLRDMLCQTAAKNVSFFSS